MKLILFVFCCFFALAVAQKSGNLLEVALRHGLHYFIRALAETNNLNLLTEAGNITVFIPTNAAFRDVSSYEMSKWRTNPSYYKDLMRYHFVKGRLMRPDLYDEDALPTLANAWPTARFVNYKGFSYDMQMYQAVVINTYDIEASNGVIHLLNQVVSAPQNQTIIQVLQGRRDLSNFTAMVKNCSGILRWLDGSMPHRPVTLVAPNNEALLKLPSTVWNRLTTNVTALEEVLKFQILQAGTWFSRSLKDGLKPSTLNNGNRTVHIELNGVFLDKALIVVRDLAATNGVVHIVDTFVLPMHG